MTFTEAAVHVLRLVGKPLHYKEITEVAIEKELLSHVGKSPEVTMGSRLAAQVKKAAKDNPLARVKPGVFALAEWDQKTIDQGLSDRTPALQRIKRLEAKDPGDSASDSADDAEVASSPLATHRELGAQDSPPDEDEQHRAELSATAASLFESEEDDDQPIFGGSAEDQDDKSSESDGDRGDGGREASSDRGEGKRRRRRRRGRGRKDEDSSDDGDDLPTYTVSDADPDDIAEIDDSSDLGSVASEQGASLADLLEKVLTKYDRAKGPVAPQNLADAMRRKGGADVSVNAGGVVAIAAADNLAAQRQCRVARFRIAGNKVGLVAWSSDRRLSDKQKALARAALQLREATVKSLADELKKLSQRAVGELVTVLLGRMGVVELASVRRPGAHGSELHLSGTFAQGAVSIPTAIMIRRDGKDVGRERVTELRGALHHYGPAAQGWIISTGQVLSGAREEAGLKGASPVALIGRTELAELCALHGVGVSVERIEIPTLDVDLLESLQGR